LKISAKYFRLAVGFRSSTSRQKQPKTYLTFDVNHKKTKQICFSLQTQRLAESFEGLNSSLAQSAEELCSW